MSRWYNRAAAALRSAPGNNALWFTSLTAAERLFAVVQTILISRALGIHEYGVYGLLFSTLGLVASLAGLQIGLTATVYVSRYLKADPAKVASVITQAHRFAWLIAGACIALLVPFSRDIARFLLHQEGYQAATVLGIIFIAATIGSGIQDGIAQGFEAFRLLAKLKIAISVVVLAVIYPVAKYLSLNGVLLMLLLAVLVKIAFLALAVRRLRSAAGVPRHGRGVSFRELILHFALPSMAVSLLSGAAMWFGLFLLSRAGDGFADVAVSNTGLQWRGPALLVASSLGTVALPMFSRFSGLGDMVGSAALRNKLVLLSAGCALVTALPLVAGAPWVMRLYGPGFQPGALAFSLIVLSAIPAVIVNVYMQELVGAARMWQQLWLNVPYALALTLSFLELIPRYGVDGYAFSLLGSTFAFLLMVMWVNRRSAKQTTPEN